MRVKLYHGLLVGFLLGVLVMMTLLPLALPPARWYVQAQALPSTDPCEQPSFLKQSAAVTASGQAVGILGLQRIFVCSYQFTLGGTTPTVTFQHGTGTNCGTNTASYSGAIAPAPNGTVLTSPGSNTTLFQTLGGEEFCVTLGGTTPTVAGYITFVQL